MPVQHVIAFKYAPSVTPEAAEKIGADFLQLQETCKNTAGEKYIRKVVGGKVTANGHEKGFEQVFIVELESEEDLKYYNVSDTIHDAFRTQVRAQAVDVVVLDFTEGKF